MEIIATCQPAAAQNALEEIFRADKGARLVRKLTFGEMLVEITLPYGELAGLLKDAVFLRHMFLVIWNGTLDYNAITARLDPARTAAVQARFYGKADDIPLEERLRNDGFIIDRENPIQIVSVYGHEGNVYLGVSFAAENLSKTPAPRYNAKLISRAGYKLMETLDYFGLNIPENGRALDLGAAPGGFSEVLLNMGMNVVAVDPADMDARVASREKFTHFKGLAQRYDTEGTFNIITNDMRLDIMDSARIMIDMRRFLAKGGAGVITLKLSDGQWRKKTDKAVNLLSRSYSVVGAKQLFHNRSEVTVVVE